MFRASAWLLCLIALTVQGCDLVVDLIVAENQTTTLANRSAVSAQATPNAVMVRPGGTLIVADADLVGLGRVIEQGDRLRPAGAAIVSSQGTVQIQAGKISAGDLMVVPQDPNTPPPPMFPREILVGTVLAPALEASDSVVRIDGGTLVSSRLLGSTEGISTTAAPAVSMLGGELWMRGGVVRPGVDAQRALDGGIALEANRSRVMIEAGSLEGGVFLSGSQTRISGGSLQALALGRETLFDEPVPVGLPGCTEIHGGTIGLLSFYSNSETVFLFGSDFNLPLARVELTQSPAAIAFAAVVGTQLSVRVSGVLEDGTPIDLQLLGPLGNLLLAAPGDPGCGL